MKVCFTHSSLLFLLFFSLSATAFAQRGDLKHPDALAVKSLSEEGRKVRSVRVYSPESGAVDLPTTQRREVYYDEEEETSYEDSVFRYRRVPVYQENLTNKRHIQRVDRSAVKAVFVPKGLWMMGATVNYMQWDNQNENLLVLKNLNMDGHSLSVSPAFGYFVKNNVAIGLRYNYGRNYFFLGSMDLNLGEDFNISLEDLYYQEYRHTGSFFLRNYMSLFGSKILGCFSEVRASYSHTTGMNTTGRRDEQSGLNTLDGTYERINTVQLGFSPGVCVFVTDFAAVETSIGVLGIEYQWGKFKNLHPGDLKYEYGKRQGGGANFRFNLFSINFGMTFYL